MWKQFNSLSEDELRTKLEEADLEKLDLITERNQAREDLKNVENAFTDVHSKYERARIALENFRLNEDMLKKRDQEMLDKISNRDQRIEEMKDRLQETLERLHADYESRVKDIEAENARMRVQLRKAEMKADALENESGQKQREIQKLNALCDELVSGKI